MAEATPVTGWESWQDMRGNYAFYKLTIAKDDARTMSRDQIEMFNDAFMLITSALRKDTKPKWLASVGAMSHAAPTGKETRS